MLLFFVATQMTIQGRRWLMNWSCCYIRITLCSLLPFVAACIIYNINNNNRTAMMIAIISLNEWWRHWHQTDTGDKVIQTVAAGDWSLFLGYYFFLTTDEDKFLQSCRYESQHQWQTNDTSDSTKQTAAAVVWWQKRMSALVKFIQGYVSVQLGQK